MNIITRVVNKYLKSLVLILLAFVSFNLRAVIYTVDRAGGLVTDGAGNVGSFAYVIDQMRGTAGPHTVNFTFVGTIDHTGGLGDWREPWTLSCNVTGTETIANQITINGNGATLSWAGYVATGGPNYGNSVLTIESSFVVINDLNFTGAIGDPGPPIVPGAGLIVSDAYNRATANFTDVTLNNCTFYNNGFGISNSTYCGVGACTPSVLFNLTINNCISYNNLTHGAELSVINGLLVTSGSEFRDNTQGGLVIKDAYNDFTQPSQNITINGGSIFNNNGKSGLQVSHANNLNINTTGGVCEFDGNDEHGIFFTAIAAESNVGVTASSITGAICDNNGSAGVDGAGVVLENGTSTITIDGISASQNWTHGVWLRSNCDDNIIRNSDCSRNGYLGATLAVGINLALGGCDNNLIEDNTCDSNEIHGIYIYNSTNTDNAFNIIQDNIITQNGTNGINLLFSTQNIIRRNLVGTSDGINNFGNGTNGIRLSNGSNSNEVRDNVIIFNGDNGIEIHEGNFVPAATGTEVDILTTPSNLNIVTGNRVGIAINESDAGNGLSGILIQTSNNNTIGGLLGITQNTISGNTQHGITVNGGDGNTIAGNIVGLDSIGTTIVANDEEGINIHTGSASNIVGLAVVDGGNIVGGNGQNGISLQAAGNDNIVQNNFVGLDINGTGVVPNGFHGIDVNGGTTSTLIGGNGANEGNYVSGNGAGFTWPNGIQLNDAHQTEIYGNIVGLDVNGNAAPNQSGGINLEGASTLNVIGGQGDSLNIISAHNGAGDYGVRIMAASNNNTIQGNYIGTDPTGTAARANNVGVFITASTGNLIGGVSSEFGNVISANSDNGITITNGDNTTISANKIGVDVTGNTALSNAGMGIQVTGTDGTIIGGTNAGEGNVISANGGIGVQLTTATNSIMEGNMVGIGLDGTTNLGNGNVGIQITTGSNNNIIGGNTAAARNVVAGHGGNIGIQITGATTINNTVSGNYIGIDASGAAYANNTGIQIDNGANLNTIGGLTAAEGNVISSNQTGVIINNADNNTVQMNYIGTNTAATAGLGNVTHGILINNGSTGNTVGTIGGIGAAAGNVISSNGNQGISVEGATTTDNYIRGNMLGTDLTGTVALPNGNHGVGITDAQNTVIGGARVEERNLISGNTQNGIGGTGDDGTIVTGNYIGTDVTGLLDLGNGAGGVSFTNSTLNIIGGSTTDSINVISGNDVVGGYYFGVQNSRAEGNIIGLNALGTDTIPNYNSGFYIEGGSQNNVYYSNIVSGNGHFKNSATLTPVGHGFEFVGSGTNSVLYGNYVGTDITGTVALPNAVHGVQVGNANNMIIGGTAGWQRNVISGNGGTDPNDNSQFCTGGQLKGNGINATNSADMVIIGNFIGISTDNMPLGNSENGIQITAMTGTIIGGEGDSLNVISSNVYKGIVMNTVTSSRVSGNLIGTDSTGLVDYGNGSGETGDWIWDTANGAGGSCATPGTSNSTIGGSGIIMLNSDDNLIGGAGGKRNILSGNSESGIWMQAGSDNNDIYNNYIGLDINGTSIIKNDQDGIYIVDGSNNNNIGATGLGNVIAGNDSSGIYIGAENWGSGVLNGITVVDNIIGLDVTGTTDLGNGKNGVEVNGAVSNVNIGSATVGNLISGNTDNGILFEGSTNTTVIAQSNIIGLNITGDDAIPNGSDGVEINASSGVQVGTTTAGNTISGNTLAGVYITNGSNTNTIFNNNIGTQTNGTDSLLATNSNATGVLIDGGSQNSIGGTNAGEANIIATNEGDGINITDGNVDNPIRRNSFFCNGARAIEENTSGNDKGGAPFWTSPLPPMGIETAGATDVFCFEVLTLPANAILEIYQKGPCQDCGDSIQGQTYIGQAIADGTGQISYDFGSKIAPADYSTYIYTITEDPGGLVSTSEFSPCSYQKVPPCTDPAAVINTAPATICQGDSIELVAADFPTLLYTWYESSDLATPLNGAGRVVGDNTFYVTVAGDYQVLIEDLPCDSLSAPVTITVDAMQTAPDAGPNDTICISALPYTLAGNAVALGTWVDENAVGATFTPDANTNNAQVNNLPGDAATSLIWASRSTLGVCPVLRDTVIIQVDNLPSAANAGIDQTICETALPATLAATTPAIGVGGWVVASGTATIADTTSATSTVSGIAAGSSAHLGWIVSNGVCPTDSQNVVINVDASPSPAVAGADQTICETALPATMAATAPAIGTGVWTVASGTATPDTPGSATTTVSGIPAGTSATLVWTVSNGNCPDVTDDVTVNVDASPDAAAAGPDDIICETDLPATLAATPVVTGSGGWVVFSGTATITDTTSPTSTVTGIPAGTSAHLGWITSNGVCPTDSQNVVITVDAVPAAAVDGGAYQTCNLATFNLNATAVSLPNTGVWNVITPGITIDNPNSPTSTVSGVTSGTTYTIEWEVSNGGVCPSNTDQTTFLLDANPVATITIDSPSPVCEGTNQTITATPNGGSNPQIRWFINGVIDPSYNDMTAITDAFNVGDNVFASIQATDPCFLAPDDTDSSAVENLSIDQQPTADAGLDVSTCGDTATVQAATPAFGNGAWSTNGASSASATVSPVASPTAAVTNISPIGSPLILDWTVTNGTCSDVDQVVVTSAPIPNPSVTIAGDQEICENTSPGTFTATASNFGSGVSYQWYENGVAVGTNASTYNVGTLTANGDVSVAITSTDACGSGLGDSIGASIVVVPLPNESITGDAFICPNVGGTISTTPAAADSYQWVLNGANNLGTGTSQAVSVGGSYTVIATNTVGSTSCPVTSPAFIVTSATITADVFGVQNYSTTVILPDDGSTEHVMVVDGNTNGTPTWTGASVGNIDATNVTDPTGTFPVGVHTLTLTGSSSGCDATATFTLIVRGPIWVPTAFSPGNGDGSNDTWSPQGLDGWDEWTVNVYNRWGSLVHTQEYDGSPFVPWDGIRNGQPMPVGTYYFVVDVPGAGTFTGPLTLMR